jgi:class 3 adenylate cyclase
VAGCGACGQVNPEMARFCLSCDAPLERQSPPLAEERKTVTVLFCDLVGFTAASDQADPEDVRARIRPYHARLRREIEGFGGTAEKFIGDAVMAVFGPPESSRGRWAARMTMSARTQARPKSGQPPLCGLRPGPAG